VNAQQQQSFGSTYRARSGLIARARVELTRLSGRSFRQPPALRALGVALLLALALGRRFANWPAVWDISPWDETGYLSIGLYYGSGMWLNYQLSPLYAGLFRIVHLIVPSLTTLYMVVGLFVICCASAALFVGMLLISRSLFLATAITAMLLSGEFLTQVPRMGYAAVTVLAIGLTGSLYLHSIAGRAAALTLTAFLLTFIRPEFLLSFYIFLAVCAVAILQHAVRGRLRPFRRWELLTCVLCLGSVAVLSVLWSFPTFQGTARAYTAFTGHYSVRYGAEVLPFVSPDQLIMNSVLVMERVFPGASSEWDALLIKPLAVIRFWKDNLVDTPKKMWQIVGRPLITRAPVFTTLCILLVGMAGLSTVRRLHRLPDHFARAIIRDLLPVCGLGVSLIASYVMVYPDVCYLVPGIALVALALAVVGRHMQLNGIGTLSAVLAAIGVVTIPHFPPVEQPILHAVHALDQQGRIGNILSADGYWCVYMPHQCWIYTVPYADKQIDLERYMRSNKIDHMIMSTMMSEFAAQRHQQNFVESINAGPNAWDKRVLTPTFVLLTRPGSPSTVKYKLDGPFAEN
jgi:hypothetical protein